jgi:glycosyltransferase involved in cell wall biosynthesis
MKKNLLIMSKSYVYSTENVNMTKYLKMNEFFSGDFFGTTTDKKYKHYPLDDFTLLCAYLPKRMVKFKALGNFYFILYAIFIGIYRHYFVKKYDVIIAREPIFAGPVSVVLKLLTGAKLVTELNGNYVSPHVWADVKSKVIRSAKYKYSKLVIPFILRRSDVVKCLYESQVESYLNSSELDKVKVVSFHNYTPVSHFEKSTTESDYIMTMGYPYYIKGFDITISAFDRIADKHPTIILKVVGYLTKKDREYLESLFSHKNQIELIEPLEYSEAMKLVSECKFFVLASRTEAMGRVLLESMAHGKTVIGSNADGIPTFVKDGQNGLIFESENINALKEKIDYALTHDEDRHRMGDNGFDYVNTILSEDSYLQEYKKVIDSL